MCKKFNIFCNVACHVAVGSKHNIAITIPNGQARYSFIFTL